MQEGVLIRVASIFVPGILFHIKPNDEMVSIPHMDWVHRKLVFPHSKYTIRKAHFCVSCSTRCSGLDVTELELGSPLPGAQLPGKHNEV